LHPLFENVDVDQHVDEIVVWTFLKWQQTQIN
jgi:hypothetical protein